MSKVKVSQSVSEWQGHLLSCILVSQGCIFPVLLVQLPCSLKSFNHAEIFNSGFLCSMCQQNCKKIGLDQAVKLQHVVPILSLSYWIANCCLLQKLFQEFAILNKLLPKKQEQGGCLLCCLLVLGQIEAFTDGILEVETNSFRHAASIFRAIPESDHDSQSETQILNARDHSIVPYCRTQFFKLVQFHLLEMKHRGRFWIWPWACKGAWSKIGKNLSTTCEALNGLCDIDRHSF